MSLLEELVASALQGFSTRNVIVRTLHRHRTCPRRAQGAHPPTAHSVSPPLPPPWDGGSGAHGCSPVSSRRYIAPREPPGRQPQPQGSLSFTVGGSLGLAAGGRAASGTSPPQSKGDPPPHNSGSLIHKGTVGAPSHCGPCHMSRTRWALSPQLTEACAWVCAVSGQVCGARGTNTWILHGRSVSFSLKTFLVLTPRAIAGLKRSAGWQGGLGYAPAAAASSSGGWSCPHARPATPRRLSRRVACHKCLALTFRERLCGKRDDVANRLSGRNGRVKPSAGYLTQHPTGLFPPR